MNEAPTKETLGFQAEVTQLLHLMIHSLYGNKQIFLRELVSNASDACDRLRFDSISNAALLENDAELRIRVSYDKAARTITIADNGIGMSRQEVVEHIGTIAKSGTKEFLQTLTSDNAKDAHLIGQFGVGFYSSFIVADRVTLVTRRAGLGADEGVQWESAGEGSYTVEPVRKDGRGTDVILHLRPDEDDLLSGTTLRTILRKYSDHITVPVLMRKERWDAEARAQVVTDEEEQVNQASALWARPKSEISEEQYHEFYKHVAHDDEPPLAFSHARVEGRQEYTQLLFIPGRAPYDLWDREHRRGIKLYVKRVFIMDDAKQLMPEYLRFVRGVIDSNDLPLNVSREILQQSKIVETIRAASVKRVLGLLDDLAAQHPEKYATFWKEFGRAFKEGIVEDPGNKERVAALLRFATTHEDRDEQTVSLADYVGRMKSGQDAIYYVTADGFPAAVHSPHLEIFRKNGDRGPADVRPGRRMGGLGAHGIRRQAAALGHQGRPQSRRHRRGGEAGRERAGAGVQGADRTDSGGAEGSGQRGAPYPSPDRLPRVPGQRRTRHEHEPGTAAEGVGPEHPVDETGAGDQPAPSDRRAPEGRNGRQPLRRLEPHAVRPGDARRGRPPGRPGHVREASQHADADARRRSGVEDLDAGRLIAE